MDVFAHALAQCPVHELMLAHFRKAPEKRAYDDRFEMAAVAAHFDMIALHAFFDELPDLIGIHECLYAGLMQQLVTGADERIRKP